MNNNSEPMPIISPMTTRTLWMIAVAVAGFLLVLNLWVWARRGQDWTTFLGPLGMLLLIASYPVARSRGRLYLVLQMFAIGLLSADLILLLKRW